jgi:sugar-specific transcriptional regulator TrmB
MQNLKTILKELGLSENEAKAYQKLLVLRESTASRIGKELKMSRRIAYDTMERLVGKGLVSFVEQEGKRIYKPAPPSKLLEMIRAQKERIQSVEKELESIVKNISTYLSDQRVNVMVLFGKEGVKCTYENELEVGEPINVICTYIDKTEELLKYYLPRFTKERIKRGIPIRMITVKDFKETLEKYELLEARFLPKDYISPASFTVYGDNLTIILWSDEPITIMIKNKEIAGNFLNYFNLLWNIADR